MFDFEEFTQGLKEHLVEEGNIVGHFPMTYFFISREERLAPIFGDWESTDPEEHGHHLKIMRQEALPDDFGRADKLLVTAVICCVPLGLGKKTYLDYFGGVLFWIKEYGGVEGCPLLLKYVVALSLRVDGEIDSLFMEIKEDGSYGKEHTAEGYEYPKTLIDQMKVAMAMRPEIFA